MRDGLRLFYEVHPSLVLLDLSLPGIDGWQLIERIREFSRVPILIVTARSGEADKIRGLKLGADDYVTKPLSFPELLARVEAALRRAGLGAAEEPRRLRHGDILVDLDEHRAFVEEREARLTPTEFRLLAFLVERAGQLVTHRQVLAAVWGAGYAGDLHLLRMTIRNLRGEARRRVARCLVHRHRVRSRLPAHRPARRAPNGQPRRRSPTVAKPRPAVRSACGRRARASWPSAGSPPPPCAPPRP